MPPVYFLRSGLRSYPEPDLLGMCRVRTRARRPPLPPFLEVWILKDLGVL